MIVEEVFLQTYSSPFLISNGFRFMETNLADLFQSHYLIALELKVFSAELNNFTGKVSVNFGGLQRFLKLNIYGNNLGSGDADEMDFFQSLVNCSSFQYMGLTENQFEGTLPKVLAIFQHSRNFSCSSKKKKSLNFSQLAKILFLEKFLQNLYSGQHDQLIYG